MFTLLLTLGDRRDELRARLLREVFGRRRWLLSWQRLGRRRWLARLSCPDLAETVEAIGWTRCRAIASAERSLRAALDREAGDDAEQEPSAP
jgi:hypothetical protein